MGVMAWNRPGCRSGRGSATVQAKPTRVGQAYTFVDVEGFDRPGYVQGGLAAVNGRRRRNLAEGDFEASGIGGVRRSRIT